MKRALITGIAFVVLAGMAGAADLRLFLSPSSDVTQKPVTGNPEVNQSTPTTLYIWAAKDLWTGTLWNGISLVFQPTGGATVTNASLYNPNMGAETGSKGQIWSDYMKFRWQNGAVTSPAPGTPPVTTITPTGSGALSTTAVSSFAIKLGADPAYGANGGSTVQDTLAYADFIAGTNEWTGYYKLGELTLTGPLGGALFMQVGPAACVSQGGSYDTDFVSFGYGDDPVHGWLRYGQPGAVSTLADATITPEPTSLALLALAGLLLRRR